MAVDDQRGREYQGRRYDQRSEIGQQAALAPVDKRAPEARSGDGPYARDENPEADACRAAGRGEGVSHYGIHAGDLRAEQRRRESVEGDDQEGLVVTLR